MSEKEVEETEAKELDATPPKEPYKRPKRPPITRNFDEEELIMGTINFPAHTYEALRKEAFDRKVTIGSIVREAVNKHLAEGKEGEETEEIEKPAQKEKILELLEACTEDEGEEGFEDEGEQGFEIEGEQGFLAQVEERKLVGKVWTNDLLKETAEHYAVGFKGYGEDQDLDEHIERSSVAMKLNPMQKNIWADLLKSEIEETEETEEDEEW